MGRPTDSSAAASPPHGPGRGGGRRFGRWLPRLGALALGDIGKYFPPTDPQWKGADSLKLLDQVVKLVKERGWSVVNIDAVVIAERPKLKPHITEMSSRMASAIGIAPDAVGVKATTNEGLGPEGREEGISCQAVALLQRS